jgi:hypothetical protein
VTTVKSRVGEAVRILAAIPEDDLVAMELLARATKLCLKVLGARTTLHLLQRQFSEAMESLGREYKRAEQRRFADELAANIERRIRSGEALDLSAQADGRGAG